MTDQETNSKYDLLLEYFSEQERAKVLHDAKLTPNVLALFLDTFGTEAGGPPRNRVDPGSTFYTQLIDDLGSHLKEYIKIMRSSPEILLMMANATLEIGHAGLPSKADSLREEWDAMGAEKFATGLSHVLLQMLRHIPD